jgi:hypothetical protein
MRFVRCGCHFATTPGRIRSEGDRASLAFLSTRLHAAQHRIHILTSQSATLSRVLAQEKQIDFQFSMTPSSEAARRAVGSRIVPDRKEQKERHSPLNRWSETNSGWSISSRQRGKWRGRSVSDREKDLPVAHTPDVDVHEVRTAIVPHSSAMQAQCRVTQLRRGNSR